MNLWRRGAGTLLAVFLLFGEAGAESWDVGGLWRTEGEGFAQECVLNAVRVQLGLEGTARLTTVASGDLWGITSYDVNLKLSATGLGIGVWNDHLGEDLDDLILLPEVNPTLSEPFVFPTLRTEGGLSAQVTLTSATSGKLVLEGTTKVGGIDVKVGSESVLWKEGTAKPDISPGASSGCSGGWGWIALLLCWGLGWISPPSSPRQ